MSVIGQHIAIINLMVIFIFQGLLEFRPKMLLWSSLNHT